MSTPITRETMPACAPGMVRITPPGYRVPDDLWAIRTDIASATGDLHNLPLVRLWHTTRGYVIAGSAARWDEARWHVTYEMDNARHGRAFEEANEAEARAYFARLTDPQEVSARRQRDAQRADEARERQAKASAVADGVKIEAAKTYKSGWQFRADWPGLRDWCGFAKTKVGALAVGRAAVERHAAADIDHA